MTPLPHETSATPQDPVSPASQPQPVAPRAPVDDQIDPLFTDEPAAWARSRATYAGVAN
jgi:hypothetical protein